MELCHKAEWTHLKIKVNKRLAALFERKYALLDADDGVSRDSFKPRVWTVEKERAPSLEEFDHQRGFFNYSLKGGALPAKNLGETNAKMKASLGNQTREE